MQNDAQNEYAESVAVDAAYVAYDEFLSRFAYVNDGTRDDALQAATDAATHAAAAFVSYSVAIAIGLQAAAIAQADYDAQTQTDDSDDSDSGTGGVPRESFFRRVLRFVFGASASERAVRVLSAYRDAVDAGERANAQRCAAEFGTFGARARRAAIDAVYADVLPSQRVRFAFGGVCPPVRYVALQPVLRH